MTHPNLLGLLGWHQKKALKKDWERGYVFEAGEFQNQLLVSQEGLAPIHRGKIKLQPQGLVSCCIIHWSPSSAPWRVEVPPV